jgi:hypothetical protein
MQLWVAVEGDISLYNTLAFFTRSNLSTDAYIEIQDYVNDSYYYSDFTLSESWSRQRIDLNEIGIHSGPDIGTHFILYISFDISPGFLADNLKTGVAAVEFSLDDLVLEK